MKYASLDYDKAHTVVEGNRLLSWDGFDIITWRKDAAGFMDTRGKFRRGTWGIEFRYPLQGDGTWKVPVAYVDHSRSGN
jgi:hypothetical protein